VRLFLCVFFSLSAMSLSFPQILTVAKMMDVFTVQYVCHMRFSRFVFFLFEKNLSQLCVANLGTPRFLCLFGTGTATVKKTAPLFHLSLVCLLNPHSYVNTVSVVFYFIMNFVR